MNRRELEHALNLASERADAYETDLAGAYERVLFGIGRSAARRFRERATVIAATVPDWEPPPRTDDLIDGEAAARSTRKRARKHWEAALEAVTQPSLEAVGISFAVASPVLDRIIEQLAARAETVATDLGPIVADAVRAAHAQGLSVREAAGLIQARMADLAPSRALLLARSDLIAIANGGNLAVVQAANTAGAEIKTKTWLTAHDERVRPTHIAAEGQTVRVDQPFAVGVGSLMYPGDPAGPPEETWNCRCTLLYDVSPVRASRDVIAQGGPETSELGMVAVYPRPEEAEALAVEDGLVAEDLHCTLVFLGEAAELDEEAVTGAVARAVADLTGPLEGAVGGRGCFGETPDGVPVILLPDVQALTKVRERIVDRLAEVGVESPSEHGFLPHMTLTYAAEPELADEALLGLPLTFEAVSVVIGGERTDYALEGARVASPA